jgi:hypothetical protein
MLKHKKRKWPVVALSVALAMMILLAGGLFACSVPSAADVLVHRS